jgi:cellobiose phosphorylase
VNYAADDFLLQLKKEESNFYDTHPASVFIQSVQQQGSVVTCTGSGNAAPALSAKINSALLPGETKSYHIAIGLTYNKDFNFISNQVKELFLNAEVNKPLEGLFSRQWKMKLPDLSAETNDIFKREMLWNAYTLECMATYSSYFNETYVPQGMLYTYQDGENISNRDHAQAMLPLCYTNPSLAKSSLRYVMKHSTYIGEIKRGSGGFGYIEPNVYQESDEQLYLFNSIAEYLRVTKDHNFLNETVTYYPAEYQKTETVINLLKKYFIYLRDVVSTGKHGLIRILNSDWSDSFFHKYSPNLYAGTAESILNTTMALAVLPNFMQQLKSSGSSNLNPFIAAMESYHQAVLKAFLDDFGNRDFAARCYLNGGSKEKLGMDHVCIEPQGYLLQIPEISIERKKAIYKKVKAATGSPEKIGFRTREVPMWNNKGEGEDGGIWFSLEGSVIAGVITFDKTEAWSLLEKMSFNNFSKSYPAYWVGHWTAPDFINSTLSAREGLYTFWEPDLENAFKGYCSHPHSWPLYLYYKLKELDN